MDILWYIIIGIIVITIIYFIIKLLKRDNIKCYLSEMIKLQNKQVALTSNIYNKLTTPELKNVADFILQNIPPTTKIMEGLVSK